MKMYLRAGQNQKDVARMITRVVKSETNYRRLAILLFNSFERKTLGVYYVGLGVLGCFL